MSSVVQELNKKNLITPPSWLPQNTLFEGMTGSVAYGVSTDTSDVDVYGFCIPPKDMVFPHLAGEIEGFGRQKKRFEQFQQHHIIDKNVGKEYDITIFSIVKFFHLCMENNPNMVDVLFLPRRCVLHSTKVYETIREQRRMFLHKGSWHKFKGYAFAQMSKIRNKTNSENPKRAEAIAKFGYDTKFAYHCVRLMNEIEQIMVEHDLDLEKNREQLKSIRRGEWKFEDFETYMTEKELMLERVYMESTLRHSPDEEFIRNLLMNCLEEHYGSLSEVINRPDTSKKIMDEMQAIIDKYR